MPPNGERFLMIKEGAPDDANDPFAGFNRIQLVTNWFDELR